MNTWEHSLLSAYKFGGKPEDYFKIHKFLDTSRLFYHHFKHRILLHNTYGINICTQLFGDYIINNEGITILVSDIAAAHCSEDLNNNVPVLNDWFKENTDLEAKLITIPKFDDDDLNKFILTPYIISGIKATLVITCSNFGSYLCRMLFGEKAALQHANKVVQNPDIKILLSEFKIVEPWQYTENPEDLMLLKKITSATG